MDAPSAPEISEELDLQEVLTRYVDSHEGYLQAAELMENPSLANAFTEIAHRRREVGVRILELIPRDEEAPDLEGSTEGALHRWWIRLRDRISAEELEAVLIECVRGEKVLVGALQRALDCLELADEQAAVLRDARAEVKIAIEHFEMAIDG